MLDAPQNIHLMLLIALCHFVLAFFKQKPVAIFVVCGVSPKDRSRETWFFYLAAGVDMGSLLLRKLIC